MPAANKGIEKFFWLYLFINPLLDIYGGAYLYIGSEISGVELSGLITPILILRMVILLFFAAYVLMMKDKLSIITVSAIAAAWLLTVAGEFMFAESFALFTEMQTIAKYVYNIAVILVYWRLCLQSSWTKEQLVSWFRWLLSLLALVLSLAIHIPFILKVGFATYGDRFGYFGARGFFYSGNDITAVLMMLAPIAIAAYFELSPQAVRKQKLFYLAAAASALCALLAIGTKTAFIAVGATLAAFLIYAIVYKRKGQSMFLRLFRDICLGTFAIFMFLSLFGLLTSVSEVVERVMMIAEEGDAQVFLLSGRGAKFQAALDLFLQGGPYAWLFGIGRGTQRFIIEMDIFEVLFYYGLTGALTMLWIYVYLGVRLVKNFIKKPDIFGLGCFMAVGLTAGYLIIAGHVLFSVTSGFFFAFMLLISELYYADSKEDMQIFPRLKGRLLKNK